jgi:hypothetical protein
MVSLCLRKNAFTILSSSFQNRKRNKPPPSKERTGHVTEADYSCVSLPTVLSDVSNASLEHIASNIPHLKVLCILVAIRIT